MSHKAVALKEEGNKYFQAGDYHRAETLYSQAITKDPTSPPLYTNRAMSRLHLHHHDPCIADCQAALALSPHNMKAHYLLASAQLALHRPNEALASALTAYDLCLETGSASTANVAGLVLMAKKGRWERGERERRRGRGELLKECEDWVREGEEREVQGLEGRWEVGDREGEEEREAVFERGRRKREELRSVFALADPVNLGRREVPDYLIDSISFTIMHDPVITKSGNSYDRATLMEHLKRSHTDPLTREPLTWQDLRPNLALKQACDEFLAENGWAVDW